MSKFALSDLSRSRMIGLHPYLSAIVERAITITKVDFIVVEGVRDYARQEKLVYNGYSKTLDSYHLNGLAVDLAPIENNKIDWLSDWKYKEIYKAMFQAREELGLEDFPLEWGYLLWGWDMPHFQVSGYRKNYDIREYKIEFTINKK